MRRLLAVTALPVPAITAPAAAQVHHLSHDAARPHTRVMGIAIACAAPRAPDQRPCAPPPRDVTYEKALTVPVTCRLFRSLHPVAMTERIVGQR